MADVAPMEGQRTAACLGSLQLREFNHITRVVRETETATRFYCDVLGFVRVTRPPFRTPGVWLYHVATKLALHLLQNDVPQRPWQPELLLDLRDHMSFVVPDVDAAAVLLKEQNVPFIKLEHPDLSIVQMFFADPDGNVIELGNCGVPVGLIACETSAMAHRVDLTPNDLHAVVRDSYEPHQGIRHTH